MIKQSSGEDKEALAIPFRLENKGPQNSSCIDINGTPIIEWSRFRKRVCFQIKLVNF